MPERPGHPEHPIHTPEHRAEVRDVDLLKKKLFLSRADVEAYEAFKKQMPEGFGKILEGHLLERRVLRDREATPLVGEFLDAFQMLLDNPDSDINGLGVDRKVKAQLKRLQKVSSKEGEVLNVFSLLSSPEVNFSIKWDYIEKQIKPRLEWLSGRDSQDHEEYKQSENEIELQPSDEPDEYTPHRAEEEEHEGEPQKAIALVYPFFGGYYNDGAFSHFDSRTLTWSKESGVMVELKDQEIDQERKRTYRASLIAGKRSVVKLPDGWGIDKNSLKWAGDEPKSWQFFSNQEGNIYIQVTSESGKAHGFEIEIGPSSDPVLPSEPEVAVDKVDIKFPDDLFKQAREILNTSLSMIVKARKITALIRGNLTYDKDPVMEALYKQNPARYFEKIWEYKKAKCDEANTLAAVLLTKFGFHVRFLSGHSTQTKSEKGEAMLLDSNRHGWMRVFDTDARKWVRLDATPKGDPNVDEEEQDEELGEGDYGGEEEIELMSDEELQEFLEKVKEEERLEQTPEMRFAKEAGCSPEEAQRVIEVIRRLREKHRDVLDKSKTYWQKIVRTNYKFETVYRGPVSKSRGDELEEVIEARIDIRAGEKDPIGWERREEEKKKEKFFGGYEVYVAADMSGSMNDLIAGRKKSESQRDTVFLFIDSVMSAASTVRQQEHKLKIPMPVKVSLTVFGSATEVVLPITDSWGPAEQIRVYRALDQGAGGGTPDHTALQLIEKQVVDSGGQEERSKKKEPGIKKKGSSKTHRFILVVADGGSNSPSAVKTMNDHMKDKGVPVDLFLVTDEDDENMKKAAEAAYQNVSIVPDPADLAEVGLNRLTDRIKEAYGV